MHVSLSDQERERFIQYLQQEVNAIDEELIRRKIAGLGQVRWDSDLMIATSLRVTIKKLQRPPVYRMQSTSGIILRP